MEEAQQDPFNYLGKNFQQHTQRQNIKEDGNILLLLFFARYGSGESIIVNSSEFPTVLPLSFTVTNLLWTFQENVTTFAP